MTAAPSGWQAAPRIVVADHDPAPVVSIMAALREDGHTVYHSYDAPAALRLALGLSRCDLVISNSRVAADEGVDLIRQLRRHRPHQAILHLANAGYSTPELERQLPDDVPVLREPLTPTRVRRAVRALLGWHGVAVGAVG